MEVCITSLWLTRPYSKIGTPCIPALPVLWLQINWFAKPLPLWETHQDNAFSEKGLLVPAIVGDWMWFCFFVVVFGQTYIQWEDHWVVAISTVLPFVWFVASLFLKRSLFSYKMILIRLEFTDRSFRRRAIWKTKQFANKCADKAPSTLHPLQGAARRRAPASSRILNMIMLSLVTLCFYFPIGLILVCSPANAFCHISQ